MLLRADLFLSMFATFSDVEFCVAVMSSTLRVSFRLKQIRLRLQPSRFGVLWPRPIVWRGKRMSKSLGNSAELACEASLDNRTRFPGREVSLQKGNVAGFAVHESKHCRRTQRAVTDPP